MGIFIKNPETERVVREVAALRGTTITGVIDALAREALEREQSKSPRRTLESMRAATAEFRRKAGLDKTKLNVTKADFDALWEIPGVTDVEDDQ
jgi:antitoxin VapB